MWTADQNWSVFTDGDRNDEHEVSEAQVMMHITQVLLASTMPAPQRSSCHPAGATPATQEGSSGAPEPACISKASSG